MNKKPGQIKMFLIMMLLGVLMVGQVFAFPLKIEILTQEEISALSDKQLIESYIDAIVDIEAAKTFYGRAGFQLRDIEQFKNLLKFRILLIIEMKKRKMEVPQVE